MTHQRANFPIFLSVLTLALLTLAAFLPNLAALWTSDDYVLVYGIYGTPVRSFIQGLSLTTDGNLTPHRALTLWFIGRGGSAGPAAAHALALALHFTNTCIFGALVWRLFRSPMLAFLASAWFCVAPWISQPVIWWSAVCTIVSTICLLTAAHFFLSSFHSTERSRRFGWIFLACMAALIGLLFYDLWLAGFLLFVGVALLEAKEWRERIASLFLMAIPFLIWFGLVAALGPRGAAAERVGITLERVFVVFTTIHLRVANWLVGPDWGALWRMGVEALADPVQAITFFLGVGLLILVLVQIALTRIERGEPVEEFHQRRPSAEAFPWDLLLFSWLMFLASRLVIILQGGVALHSRLNYGAAMAVALVAAALARWFWHRWCYPSAPRCWLAISFAGISILGMTLVTTGRSWHMALSSSAERYTIDLLDQRLKKNPNVRSVAVLGTPVPDIGELSYFSEADGMWLQHVLRRLGHNQQVRVFRSENLPASRSSDLSLMWSGTWPEARVEEVCAGAEPRCGDEAF
jgi:hypothetical protein